MLSVPFKKSWAPGGTLANLVAPNNMTIQVTDDTTGLVVVPAGTAMLNTAPGEYEYVYQPATAGHKYTAVYTTVYNGTTYTSPPYTVSLRQPLPPKAPSPVDQLNGYMAAAIAAQAVGDYPTALNNALAAQGIVATLPNIRRGGGTGGGDMAAQWDPAGIDNFIRRLRQQQGANLGVQSVDVQITEPWSLTDIGANNDVTGGYIQ
jgi:hypothetical protein